MKKANKGSEEAEILEAYDFSKGVQGKYAGRYAEGSNVVVLDPDVSKVFPNAESVNNSLRSLAKIIRMQTDTKTREEA